MNYKLIGAIELTVLSSVQDWLQYLNSLRIFREGISHHLGFYMPKTKIQQDKNCSPGE